MGAVRVCLIGDEVLGPLCRTYNAEKEPVNMGLKQDWSSEIQGHPPALKHFSFATGHIPQCGGLGQDLPHGRGQGGLGDRVIIKLWTSLHRPPLQPHTFLRAECSGGVKTGIN